jgi:glycogen(starch) synthase
MGFSKVRILFSSHVFAPSIGGLESVSGMLAEEFARQGHEVRLITQTPADKSVHDSVPTWRQPSGATLLGLVRWCDVFFHNNISLPRAWPLLLVRRPWIVAHHVWIPRAGLAGGAKRLALRFATGIAVSSAIARHLSTPCTIIPNPYDEVTFRELPNVARNRDLVFLGRLVSDKGADVLIKAVHALAGRGLRPSVTIIGTGPEEANLRSHAEALGMQGQIRFAGARRGSELTGLLNAHRLIVIPSIWEEPFGIVALEGMACGCVPIGSAAGGLRDAIGAGGETFPNGDVAALTDVLEQLLRNPGRQEELRQRAKEQLRRHTRACVAGQYLRVFAEVLRGHGHGNSAAA